MCEPYDDEEISDSDGEDSADYSEEEDYSSRDVGDWQRGKSRQYGGGGDAPPPALYAPSADDEGDAEGPSAWEIKTDPTTGIKVRQLSLRSCAPTACLLEPWSDPRRFSRTVQDEYTDGGAGLGEQRRRRRHLTAVQLSPVEAIVPKVIARYTHTHTCTQPPGPHGFTCRTKFHPTTCHQQDQSCATAAATPMVAMAAAPADRRAAARRAASVVACYHTARPVPTAGVWR